LPDSGPASSVDKDPSGKMERWNIEMASYYSHGTWRISSKKNAHIGSCVTSADDRDPSGKRVDGEMEHRDGKLLLARDVQNLQEKCALRSCVTSADNVPI
jgi:hypothetical protein